MDEPIDAPEGARAHNDPGDITYKTETLRRGNEDMRKRIAELRDTLQAERARLRDAHVDKVTSLKKQRDMDQQEKILSLEEQKQKLLEEKRAELRAFQEQVQKQHEQKLRALMRKREEAEARRKEQEALERVNHEHTLKQLAHEEASTEFEGTMGAEIQSLKDQLADATQQRLHLERLLATKTKAEAEKSEQIRHLLEDLSKERSSISRENQMASKQETQERKKKDAEIKKLEEELSVMKRNYDRVEADRSKLNEELTRRKTADSLARRTPQKLKPGLGLYDPGLTGSAGASPMAAAVASPRRDDAADKQRIADLGKELRDARAKITALETELEAAQAAGAQRARPADGSAERIADLTRRNGDLMATSRRQQARIKELEAQTKEQEEQSRQLQDDLRKARVDLSKRTERPTPTKVVPAPKDAGLQAQVQQQAEKLAALQEQVAERDRRIESLRREQRDSQQSLSALQDKLKAANAAAATATAAAAAVSAKAAAAPPPAAAAAAPDAGLQNAQRQLAKENALLQQQLAKLKQAQAGLKEMDALKKDMAQLRAKNEALNQELQGAQAALAKAQAEVKEARAGQGQTQAQQAELAQLRSKVDALSKEKQKLTADIKSLQEQVDASGHFEQQVVDREVEVEQLNDSLAQAQKRIAALEKQVAAARTPSKAPQKAAPLSDVSDGEQEEPEEEDEEVVPVQARKSVDDSEARRKREEEAARAKAAEEAEAKKKREEEALAQKKKDEELAKKKREEEAAAQKKKDEAAAAAAKKKEEEAAAALAKRKKEDELAAQKKKEEEAVAARKRADEEAAAAKKKKEEDLLAQKRKEEEEAARRKEEEALAKKKKEEELLAQKKREEELLAQKKKEEELLAQKKREEELLAQKKREEELAAQKMKDEVATTAALKRLDLDDDEDDDSLHSLKGVSTPTTRGAVAGKSRGAEGAATPEDVPEDMDDYSDDFEPSPGGLTRIDEEDEDLLRSEDSAPTATGPATTANRAVDDDGEAENNDMGNDKEPEGPVRFFRAMFDYSPDEHEGEVVEDLPFCEEEIIAIFGDMNEDQFYFGQNRFGVRGLVPSNFVEEVDQQTARDNSPELFDSVQEFLPGPEPPKNVDVERSGEAYLLIAWNKPSDIAQLEGYRILVDGEVKAEIQGADATLGRAPLKLTPGKTYNITVVSFSRTQQSTPSAPCVYKYNPPGAAAPAPSAAAVPATATPEAARKAASLATVPAALSTPTSSISSPLSAVPSSAGIPNIAPAAPHNPTSAAAPAASASHGINGSGNNTNNKGANGSGAATNGATANGASHDGEVPDDLGNPDVWNERKRLFLVLYSYDPDIDSPNNFGDELKLDEGQIITVYGEVGEDDFYYGEHRGKRGMVPSNLVEEMPAPGVVGSNALLGAQANGSGNGGAAQGHEGSMLNNINGMSGDEDEIGEEEGEEDGEEEDGEEAGLPQEAPYPSGTVVEALYDYEPTEMSPNDDQAEELPFRQHDLLKIISGYDEDGFYLAEHKATGMRGLVPYNFLTMHKKKGVKKILGSIGRKLGFTK